MCGIFRLKYPAINNAVRLRGRPGSPLLLLLYSSGHAGTSRRWSPHLCPRHIGRPHKLTVRPANLGSCATSRATTMVQPPATCMRSP